MRLRLAVAAALTLALAPAMAAAHDATNGDAGRLGPTIGLVIVLALYGTGLARLRTRGGRVGRGRLTATLGGTVVVGFALLSPLDALAERLFSAHMAQHTLLMLVAAPLLALGQPLGVVTAALPVRTGVARALRRWRPGMAVAWTANGLALWLWHLPPLYGWALARPALHAVEHATLLVTAVMLWWSVSWQRRPLAGALWLFTTALHTSVLGALMTLARKPWFAAHAAGAAGLTGLEDQQLAGLVMWVPAGTLLTGFVMALLAAWFRRTERHAPALGPPPRRVDHVPPFISMLLLVGLAATLAGCDGARASAVTITGGDPARGRDALRMYGCHTCHTIPGVPGAHATVGPSLAQFAFRSYVAGRPNAPDHVMGWIRHPQSVRPATPMPEMSVTEDAARDIAAYLYTLR